METRGLLSVENKHVIEITRIIVDYMEKWTFTQ